MWSIEPVPRWWLLWYAKWPGSHACFFQCTVSVFFSGLWNSPRRDQHLPLLGRMRYICPAKPAAGLLKTTGICSILQKQQNFQITSQTSKKNKEDNYDISFSIAAENAATDKPCWKCDVDVACKELCYKLIWDRNEDDCVLRVHSSRSDKGFCTSASLDVDLKRFWLRWPKDSGEYGRVYCLASFLMKEFFFGLWSSTILWTARVKLGSECFFWGRSVPLNHRRRTFVNVKKAGVSKQHRSRKPLKGVALQHLFQQIDDWCFQFQHIL